jgi:hypothetical protein
MSPRPAFFSGPRTSATAPGVFFEALVHAALKSHGRTSILSPWSLSLSSASPLPLRAPHSLPLAYSKPPNYVTLAHSDVFLP